MCEWVINVWKSSRFKLSQFFWRSSFLSPAPVTGVEHERSEVFLPLLLLFFTLLDDVLNAEITISATTTAITHAARWLRRKLRWELRIQFAPREKHCWGKFFSPPFTVTVGFFFSRHFMRVSQSSTFCTFFRFFLVSLRNSLAQWYVMLVQPSKTRAREWVEASRASAARFTVPSSRVFYDAIKLNYA